MHLQKCLNFGVHFIAGGYFNIIFSFLYVLLRKKIKSTHSIKPVVPFAPKRQYHKSTKTKKEKQNEHR